MEVLAKTWPSSFQVFYDALDSLCYTLSESDYNQKWACAAWPARIAKQIEKTEGTLEGDQTSYEKEMRGEQEAFAVALGELETRVQGFERHVDLAQVDHVAAELRQLTEALDKADKDAKLFNSREGLFGAQPTDYSRLKRAQEAFEPFSQLWTIAADWKRGRAAWADDPLETLNPEEIEKSTLAWWKALFKVGKVFQNKGLAECAANCDEIRAQLDAFKPQVPLIAALRQAGMRCGTPNSLRCCHCLKRSRGLNAK